MKKYERSQAVSDDEDDEGKTQFFFVFKMFSITISKTEIVTFLF